MPISGNENAESIVEDLKDLILKQGSCYFELGSSHEVLAQQKDKTIARHAQELQVIEEKIVAVEYEKEKLWYATRTRLIQEYPFSRLRDKDKAAFLERALNRYGIREFEEKYNRLVTLQTQSKEMDLDVVYVDQKNLITTRNFISSEFCDQGRVRFPTTDLVNQRMKDITIRVKAARRGALQWIGGIEKLLQMRCEKYRQISLLKPAASEKSSDATLTVSQEPSGEKVEAPIDSSTSGEEALFVFTERNITVDEIVTPEQFNINHHEEFSIQSLYPTNCERKIANVTQVHLRKYLHNKCSHGTMYPPSPMWKVQEAFLKASGTIALDSDVPFHKGTQKLLNSVSDPRGLGFYSGPHGMLQGTQLVFMGLIYHGEYDVKQMKSLWQSSDFRSECNLDDFPNWERLIFTINPDLFIIGHPKCITSMFNHHPTMSQNHCFLIADVAIIEFKSIGLSCVEVFLDYGTCLPLSTIKKVKRKRAKVELAALSVSTSAAANTVSSSTAAFDAREAKPFDELQATYWEPKKSSRTPKVAPTASLDVAPVSAGVIGTPVSAAVSSSNIIDSAAKVPHVVAPVSAEVIGTPGSAAVYSDNFDYLSPNQLKIICARFGLSEIQPPPVKKPVNINMCTASAKVIASNDALEVLRDSGIAFFAFQGKAKDSIHRKIRHSFADTFQKIPLDVADKYSMLTKNLQDSNEIKQFYEIFLLILRSDLPRYCVQGIVKYDTYISSMCQSYFLSFFDFFYVLIIGHTILTYLSLPFYSARCVILDQNSMSQAASSLAIGKESDLSGLRFLALVIPLSNITLLYWPDSHKGIRSFHNMSKYASLDNIKPEKPVHPVKTKLQQFQMFLCCADFLIHLSTEDSASYLTFLIDNTDKNQYSMNVTLFQKLLNTTFSCIENPSFFCQPLRHLLRPTRWHLIRETLCQPLRHLLRQTLWHFIRETLCQPLRHLVRQTLWHFIRETLCQPLILILVHK